MSAFGAKLAFETARSLQYRPRILFIDEPTAGLEPQTRNEIWKFIRGLCRDEHVTVFFATHYMDEAERVVDRIAVIDHGRIRRRGHCRVAAATDRRPHFGRVHRAHRRSIREAETAPIDRSGMMRRVWLGRQ